MKNKIDTYEPARAPLAQRILDLLKSAPQRAFTRRDIVRSLALDSSMKHDLRRSIRNMEEQKLIRPLGRNRWMIADAQGQIRGILEVHRSGFGFVRPEKNESGDVYIPRTGIGAALDGDRVEVVMMPPRHHKSKRRHRSGKEDLREGRILKVLGRKRSIVTGRLMKMKYYDYIIPDSPKIPQHIRVADYDTSLNDARPKEGHTVVVRLASDLDFSANLNGTVIEDLGPVGVSGQEITCIIRNHEFQTEFSEEALSEAQKYPARLDKADLDHRKDLRGKIIFTIDPVDSRDFDDAVSLEALDNGAWRLGVHIADVSHYVKPGSRLDQEALERGTSVYLVDRVLPMLPHYLTNQVCSLTPGQDHLTHTVELILSNEGDVIDAKTYASVIQSKACLTYDAVQEYIHNGRSDDVPGAVAPVLEIMHGLAKSVRKKRIAAGSLDFSLPEIHFELGEKGQPIRLLQRGATDAYQLIEEFMLLANCAVASIIHDRLDAGLYRIHEPPDEEDWARMSADLMALGIAQIPRNQHTMNAIAKASRGSASAHIVQLAMLRNLKRATYTAHLGEHFGLAFPIYTHFTSPIRRYPDLVVHRLLAAIETNTPSHYTESQLQEIAIHCSLREREAAEAEQESVDAKIIEYYEKLLEAGERGPWNGLVVGFSSGGLWIEIPETLLRGLLPFALLGNDYYVISEDKTRAVGRHTGARWVLGKTVSVFINRIDERQKQVEFALNKKPVSGAKKKRRRT